MALPFEPVRESANRSIRGQGSNLSEIPVTYEGQVCIHCGANNGGRPARHFWALDLILGCLSCVLVVSLLLFVGSLLHSWMERTKDHVFDHWVWHEPLDDWNL